jgi:transcriptional regulator with XRE-family HTH domain
MRNKTENAALPPAVRIGGFGLLMQASMKERGMTLVDVAKAAGISYEHARRLAKGLTPPSRALTEVVSRLLGFDAGHAWDAAQSDRLHKKFGIQLDRTASGKGHPRVEECRNMLIALTPVQYQAVLSILRGFAGQQAKAQTSKKQEKQSLLLSEVGGRKFRDE